MSARRQGPDVISNSNSRADRDSAPPAHATVDVLGVPVANVTTNEFVRWLLAETQRRAQQPSTRAGTPLFITYLNAACSNISADDDAYMQILQQADCVYADGQAIVWAASWLGQPLPERVNAGDFILSFCREMSARGLRLGLLGGRPGVAANAAAAWLKEVPALTIPGAWDGFFKDNDKLITAINESDIDILLVGMGVPLQEKWAEANRHRLQTQAIWCVGALFEYYGEGRARAPVWMRRIGLEWLFRLVLEPRRLWRRYLIGNARFMRRVTQMARSRK